MLETWNRLHEVLGKVAPQVVKSLAPPAGSSGLKRLANVTGRSLPGELEQSLLVHNGQLRAAKKGKKKTPPPVLFNGQRLLSVAEIVDAWTERRDVAQRLIGTGVYNPTSIDNWWMKRLFPITEAEGDGYCLDEQGCLWYHRHDEGMKSLAGTWSKLLAKLASLVADGRFEDQSGEIWVSEADLSR
jgi:cell wall assembly regulator SMI1